MNEAKSKKKKPGLHRPVDQSENLRKPRQQRQQQRQRR